MPYGRLQYNWDSQYTIKDKRNLLLTQEVIEKINNIQPSPAQGGAQFATKAEYDVLPSSKLTDNKLYIIVDSHIAFVPFEEVLAMPLQDALDTLNTYPLEYAQHYCDLWVLDECGYQPIETEWKYFGVFYFTYDAHTSIWLVNTNLTVQEMMDELEMSEEDAEAALANNGHRFTQEIPN